jgi:hypothetical protein
MNNTAFASPQAAVKWLLEEVERLADRVSALEGNTSTGWDEWEPAERWTQRTAEDDAKEIASLQAQYDDETDEQEREAIHAKMRLLKGGHEAIRDRQPDKVRSHTEGDITTLPKASAEQQVRREYVALQLFMDGDLPKGLDSAEAQEAYVKAGSLWLYYGDRDFCTRLTTDLKTALVQDCLDIGATQEALEMGRDLLKDTSGGENVFAANLEGTMGHVGGGV